MTKTEDAFDHYVDSPEYYADLDDLLSRRETLCAALQEVDGQLSRMPIGSSAFAPVVPTVDGVNEKLVSPPPLSEEQLAKTKQAIEDFFKKP